MLCANAKRWCERREIFMFLKNVRSMFGQLVDLHYLCAAKTEKVVT